MKSLVTPVQSYPERLGRVSPLPYWLVMLIFWMAVFAVDFQLSAKDQHYSHYTELGITFFYASIGIALGLTCRIMNNLYKDILLFVDAKEEEIGAWYFSKLRLAYTGWAPWAAGLLFALVVELTAGHQVDAYSQANEGLLYFRMVYRFTGFVLLGMSMWALMNMLFLPSGLARFPFKSGLSTLSGFGFFSLGNAFVKMSLITIACFFVLVCTIMVSPLAGDPIVLIWVLAGSVLIFCFFLLPLISIHRIMTKEKREQFIFFSGQLDAAFTDTRKNPSLENLAKVKEMLELHQHLKNLNDWPFNTAALWQLISVLLIPLLMVVLQIVFQGS